MELVEGRSGVGKRHKIYMLRVSTTEAVQLIKSLSSQILSQSPNMGRLETFLKDGSDFSIAVHPAPLERSYR